MPERIDGGAAPAGRIVIEVPPTIDPEAVLEQLGLEPVGATLIVNGGTEEFSDAEAEAIAGVMRLAIEELARHPHPVVLTGGTGAGVFLLAGDAIGELGFPGPVVGVVPAGKVDARSQAGTGRKPIERHHTHVVAVEGTQWGDETPVMMSVSGALARRGPVAVIIAGGGDIAERELDGHEAAGRRPIVLRGTGRLADRARGVTAVDVGDLGAVVGVLRSRFQGE